VTRVAYKPFGRGTVLDRRSVSSTDQRLISRFANAVRELPVQLNGISPVCFGANVTSSTIFYKYVIAFSTSASARPDFVVVDADACNNIQVTSNDESEPLLDGEVSHGSATPTQPLDLATAALFSPGLPLRFAAG
jgi:hypothetical protein